MDYDTFRFKGSSGIISLFMPELQKGFYVSSCEGTTVHSFLVNACRMDESYIAQKVKTVLINGGPVDDILNTEITDGGTCAVSGAMPGIVGAMMRMGSPYAAMRESITVKPGRSQEHGKQILIMLKLFNVVLSDRGPGFLKAGILVEKKRVLDLVTACRGEVAGDCREIMFNDSSFDAHMLNADEYERISGLVILKVEIEDENNN